MDIFEEIESCVRTYARSFPAVFSSGSGCHIKDRDGRQWIDFLACAGALNYGHNPPKIVDAIVDYLKSGGILASLDLKTESKLSFLTAFRDIILSPRGLEYRVQFTGPTGANSIEAALKLARIRTGRRNVIAFTGGYHGVSLGALAATANRSKRAGAGVSFGDVTRLPYDGYLPGLDCLSLIERMLEDPGSGLDAPAAVLIETVQGEGGLNAASPDWFRGIADLARRYGALLIVDDIQAGCGRSGTFFSFEPFGTQPDLICLSKSISGIGLPMSLLLIRPDHDVWEPGQHNGTFRGNNLAFISARVALEEFWADDNFAGQVGRRSLLLDAQLKSLVSELAIPDCELRGRGLMRGIAFADPQLADAVSALCFETGLICETCGPRSEVLKLLPPLTISEAELSHGVSIIQNAIISCLSTRQTDCANGTANRPARSARG